MATKVAWRKEEPTHKCKRTGMRVVLKHGSNGRVSVHHHLGAHMRDLLPGEIQDMNKHFEEIKNQRVHKGNGMTALDKLGDWIQKSRTAGAKDKKKRKSRGHHDAKESFYHADRRATPASIMNVLDNGIKLGGSKDRPYIYVAKEPQAAYGYANDMNTNPFWNAGRGRSLHNETYSRRVAWSKLWHKKTNEILTDLGEEPKTRGNNRTKWQNFHDKVGNFKYNYAIYHIKHPDIVEHGKTRRGINAKNNLCVYPDKLSEPINDDHIVSAITLHVPEESQGHHKKVDEIVKKWQSGKIQAGKWHKHKDILFHVTHYGDDE